MKIQKAIEINAPPEKIWQFFVEPEKVLQWCITFKKFEYSGIQRSGKGTPLYIEEEAGGRLSKMRFDVIEWKENEKFAIRMVSGGTYKSYDQCFSVEPTPSGCKVSFMEEIVLPYYYSARLRTGRWSSLAKEGMVSFSNHGQVGRRRRKPCLPGL